MAKYLIHGNYVGDGIKGLMKDGGSKRREAVKSLVESVGGTVECIYYAFGETDVFVILDVPDHASATALSLMVNASGAVTLRTTVLMTPEEIDAAVKKTPKYRAPGA